MFVFHFIIALIGMTLPITNAASNCSVCQLGNYFSETNGYGCFELTDGHIACTCPDQRYILDEPCRICQRPNICGDDPQSFCAETTPLSLGVQTNDTNSFACFCQDTNFYVGKPCPSVPVVQPTEPVVTEKN